MTKEKFLKYEEIRVNGVTNMVDVPKVIYLSADILDKADCLDIMKNYTQYEKKFLTNQLEDN